MIEPLETVLCYKNTDKRIYITEVSKFLNKIHIRAKRKPSLNSIILIFLRMCLLLLGSD